MKHRKKLKVIIEYPNGHVSEISFDTEKGARLYFSLKSKGGALLNGSNHKFEIPKNIYLK